MSGQISDLRSTGHRCGAEPPIAHGASATRWIIPVGVVACYALFTLAVHLRMLDALDLAVRGVYRPVSSGDRWRCVPTVSSSLKGRGFVNGLSTSGFLAFGLRVGGTG